MDETIEPLVEIKEEPIDEDYEEPIHKETLFVREEHYDFHGLLDDIPSKL